MNYCKKCGKQIDDGAAFCPYCASPQNTPVYQSYDATYGTNGFAIAGFILSFLGGLLGLIFSIIGCVKAPQYGGKGRGLAIAGITISCVWFVIFLLVWSI